MTTVLVIAAFLAGASCGSIATKVRWRRDPVNIVRGMLLPSPSDERWDRIVQPGVYNDFQLYALGTVHVERKAPWRVWVDDIELDGARKYAAAVIRSQQERKALEAAL